MGFLNHQQLCWFQGGFSCSFLVQSVPLSTESMFLWISTLEKNRLLVYMTTCMSSYIYIINIYYIYNIYIYIYCQAITIPYLIIKNALKPPASFPFMSTLVSTSSTVPTKCWIFGCKFLVLNAYCHCGDLSGLLGSKISFITRDFPPLTQKSQKCPSSTGGYVSSFLQSPRGGITGRCHECSPPP